MPSTLTIHDETASGQRTNTFTLDCLTERMTVRELIRARIYQEVQDYNQREPEYFRGLVEPTAAGRVLNGYKLKAKRKIDWNLEIRLAMHRRENYQPRPTRTQASGWQTLITRKGSNERIRGLVCYGLA